MGYFIAMLREKIGLSPEGGYTKEAAEKLYQYGRNRWRTGRGYLYSDNDPEILFDAGYKEYVTVVNSEVWVLAELDINYFHDNEYAIWKVIEPGGVMYDQHGRTESKEPDQEKLVQAPLRILSAGSNVMRQNRIDKLRAGLDASEGTDNFFNDFQKVIWAAGAEAGYGFAGTELTWYLLTHSLSANPEPVIIEEGVSYLFDGIIDEIKNDTYFLRKLNEYLQDKPNSFDNIQTKGLNFRYSESFDLKSAINKCELWLSGQKNEDGSWKLEIEIKDSYDFTEFENPKWYIEEDEIPATGKTDQKRKIRSGGQIFAWTANDLAHLYQNSGAIIPFSVTIRFAMKNYKVEE